MCNLPQFITVSKTEEFSLKYMLMKFISHVQSHHCQPKHSHSYVCKLVNVDHCL